MVRMTRQYASDLGQLASMRAFVRETCQQAWGVPADAEELAQLELALQEAAVNIVEHAYQGEEGRPIELEVDAGPEQVCVCLYHCGRDFDPATVAPPAFGGSEERGFGLYLIRQSVDEVRFFHDAGGRCGVCLVKKRPQAKDGGGTCNC